MTVRTMTHADHEAVDALIVRARTAMRQENRIGRQHLFSTEKRGTVLAIYRFHGFDGALDKVREIFETGGKGHSCGIYSFR